MVVPVEEEEEAGLARSGVVGELVEEFVEHGEARREFGEGFAELLRGWPQFVHYRQDFAGERAHLVLDDRGRRLRQPACRFVGRAESARERLELLEGWAEHFRGRRELAEAGSGLAQRCRQQLQRFLEVRVLLGERREHRVRRVHQLRELLVLAAERFGQQAEVVDRAGDVRVPDFELLGDLLSQLSRRVEAPEVGGQRLSVALEPDAEPRDQLLHVGPRFRVEAREEFIEVDVRRRLGERDHLAAAQLPGGGRARVDLDRDVLQLGLWPQQQRRVAVDVLAVLGDDVHRDDRDPVVQVDGRDFADLRAGDRDRLTLAGGDRLRRLEFGPQRVEATAEHRHPARKLQVLVGEDVATHSRCDHDHHNDSDERRAVSLDLVADTEPAFVAVRGRHPSLPSAAPSDKGPLKLGSVCVSQATCGS